MPADGTGPKKHGKSRQPRGVLTPQEPQWGLPGEPVCWPMQLDAVQGCRGAQEGEGRLRNSERGSGKGVRGSRRLGDRTEEQTLRGWVLQTSALLCDAGPPPKPL